MKLLIDDITIKEFEKVLNCQFVKFDKGLTFKLTNKESVLDLIGTIYLDAGISKAESGVLVSIQTRYGYFELHNVTNFMIFEPDELIFLNYDGNKVQSLIIGASCNCSLFSNIDKELLNTDFSELDPAVLMSAMQLSLTESLLLE